jgi:uncharacterized protein (DUF302 family)
MHKLLLALASLAFFVSSAYAANGLIAVESNFSVEDTLERLETVLIEKGMSIVERINHTDGAARVGQELRPTELLIFGNPRVGTPLMQCNRSVAIDLPQKILVWQDEQEKVWLAYNDPDYLKTRHELSGCDEAIGKVKEALAGFAAAATKD